MTTDVIRIETGAGIAARVLATGLSRVTEAEYKAIDTPADDTLYIVVPDNGESDRNIKGIYQGANIIYGKGLSGFDLYYLPFSSTPLAVSDGAFFTDSVSRALRVRC